MHALLGLDFGEKKIGVAVTDEAGMIATPLTTLAFQSRKQLLEDLTRICDQYRVSKIVVGLPITMNGDLGPSAQKVMGHVEWLKSHLEKVWVFWDERLTTQEVENFLISADVSRQRRKEVRDRLAAQRILQGYMDSQQNEKEKS